MRRISCRRSSQSDSFSRVRSLTACSSRDCPARLILSALSVLSVTHWMSVFDPSHRYFNLCYRNHGRHVDLAHAEPDLYSRPRLRPHPHSYWITSLELFVRFSGDIHEDVLHIDIFGMLENTDTTYVAPCRTTQLYPGQENLGPLSRTSLSFSQPLLDTQHDLR